MIKRIFKATKFSVQGIWSALRAETAFLQEFIVLCLIIPLVVWLDLFLLEKISLILAWVFVMIVELINSAIEAVCDELTTEIRNGIKLAKDYGSAAVCISLICALTIWASILWVNYA